MRKAKKAIYCMMPTAWQGKTGEHKKLMIAQIQGQEGKRARWTSRAQGYLGSGTILYETWHHMWSKLTELCNTSEVVWAVDLVKRMHQYSFNNNQQIIMQDVISLGIVQDKGKGMLKDCAFCVVVFKLHFSCLEVCLCVCESMYHNTGIEVKDSFAKSHHL